MEEGDAGGGCTGCKRRWCQPLPCPLQGRGSASPAPALSPPIAGLSPAGMLRGGHKGQCSIRPLSPFAPPPPPAPVGIPHPPSFAGDWPTMVSPSAPPFPSAQWFLPLPPRRGGSSPSAPVGWQNAPAPALLPPRALIGCAGEEPANPLAAVSLGRTKQNKQGSAARSRRRRGRAGPDRTGQRRDPPTDRRPRYRLPGGPQACGAGAGGSRGRKGA